MCNVCFNFGLVNVIGLWFALSFTTTLLPILWSLEYKMYWNDYSKIEKKSYPLRIINLCLTFAM
jgi:hypothetical protein